MKKINVRAEREYIVSVGCDWTSEILRISKGRSRVGIIHTREMRPRVQLASTSDTQFFYFEVPDGEDAKSFVNISRLWNMLGEAGFTRTDLIVGVGGGAVTDVAGFAAASWLRGIEWIGVPTSIAGMVDASIGGKTGINSEYGKNLIGAFHSPSAVLIDISWLNTLSDRDFAAGMAEVIKCGFIFESNIVELLQEQTIATLRADIPRVLALIEASVTTKAQVVSTDFKESFVREVLNYGHTLGHAIEIHSKYSLRHGEAIAIGLVFAAEIANINGDLDSETVALHRQLLTSLGLPITYPRVFWKELLPLLYLDKKTRGSTLRFVAISSIGKTHRIEGLTPDQLSLAYERISS